MRSFAVLIAAFALVPYILALPTGNARDSHSHKHQNNALNCTNPALHHAHAHSGAECASMGGIAFAVTEGGCLSRTELKKSKQAGTCFTEKTHSGVNRSPSTHDHSGSKPHPANSGVKARAAVSSEAGSSTGPGTLAGDALRAQQAHIATKPRPLPPLPQPVQPQHLVQPLPPLPKPYPRPPAPVGPRPKPKRNLQA